MILENNMSEFKRSLVKPEISLPKEILEEAGFINSGIEEFRKMTSAFSDDLFEKSIHIGNAGSSGEEREVTREHVKKAAHMIYGRTSEVSKTSVALQLVEYIASAGVGVGASNLSVNWGIGTFGISLSVLVIAFVARIYVMNKNNL